MTRMRILPVTGRVIISCRSPRRRHGPRPAGGSSRRCATAVPRAVAGGPPLRVPRPLHSPAPLSAAGASPPPLSVGGRRTACRCPRTRARRRPVRCLSALARRHRPLCLCGGLAAAFVFFLAFAVAPPCGRRSRALRCGCAAAPFPCLPRPRRRGATVEAVQSAASGTRPPRRRSWPPPTRGRQRPVLLAYPSRPPDVLELIQQPEGHSALLLFFPVSLYLFLSLPAGPDFRSASSFGGTRLACFGIKMSRSWRLCPSTSGYGQAATVRSEQINRSHVIEILARDSRRLHFIASHQAAVISSSDYCRRARESWLIRPFLPPTRDPEPSTRTTMEQDRVCWASVR